MNSSFYRSYSSRFFLILIYVIYTAVSLQAEKKSQDKPLRAVKNYQELSVFLIFDKSVGKTALTKQILYKVIEDTFLKKGIKTTDFSDISMEESWPDYPDRFLQIEVSFKNQILSWEMEFHREVIFPPDKQQYIYSDKTVWSKSGNQRYTKELSPVLHGISKGLIQFSKEYVKANKIKND